MIAIHIVCTYDGMPLAETLMRLLEAQEHAVRMSFGRASANDLDAAKASSDAVLLIWSADAPGQHYMKEWAKQIPEHRLVEIASAAGWPRSDRKAPVIDFTTWRGTRGARAWNTLTERLRQMQRAIEPQRPPPKRAALALGLASLAAVSGAIMVRVNQDAVPQFAPTESGDMQSIAVIDDPSVGVGGPLRAVEPASLDELTLELSPNPRIALLDAGPAPELMDLAPYEPLALRDPTLVERISDFNPLRRDSQTTND